MSLITKGLSSELLITAGLGEESVLATSSVSVSGGVWPQHITSELPIQNIVHSYKDYIPLTGTYSLEEDIPGWIWDRRRWESFLENSSKYNTYLGGHYHGLKDGTIKTWWNSGSVQDTQFLSVEEYKALNEALTWTPTVKSGRYSTFFMTRSLFSDYSFTTNIDPLLNENGVNTLKLRDDCIKSSIEFIVYERDEDLVRIPKFRPVYKEVFTGKLVDGKRIDPRDENSEYIWENLETRKYEYTIIEKEDGTSHIYTNQDFSIQVGGYDYAVTADVAKLFLENKGNGVPSGRNAFTNYFPLKKYSVDVYILKATGALEKWKEVETLDTSRSTDRHYTVDYDLGIISIGGYQAPALSLKEPIDEDDTEIEVYIDYDILDSYPDTGVISIGDEYIYYYGKTRSKFINCVRGYYDTVPSEHTYGAKVQDIQHGKSTSDSDTIYLRYTAVPRVQYEVTQHDIRTANKIQMLDVKPSANVKSNNIIMIDPVEPNLAEIILEIDSPLIGGQLHGPLFYGTDIAKLTATAYDTKGNPVEGIDLCIVLNESTGTLNGGLSEVCGISNSLGQIYALYNAPYDWDSVSKDVIRVEHQGGHTLMTLDSNLPAGLKPYQITLFQILKHDPVIGTVGVKAPAINAWNNVPYSDGSLEAYGKVEVDTYISGAEDRFSGGWCHILFEDGTKYTRTIMDVYDNYLEGDYSTLDTSDGSWPDSSEMLDAPEKYNTMLLLNASMPVIGTGVKPVSVWMFGKDEQEFNRTFKDGIRVLLYEWRDDITHPLKDGELGAYYPVRPGDSHMGGSITGIGTKTLKFYGRNIAIPDAWDDDLNLAGYSVVCGDQVSFYAWGKDPVSGRVIISNTIKLRIDLPPYLVGVDDPGGALPIPYGFTFVTEDFNVGTGIGGANFLTVNPAASGTNTFSIMVKDI